MTEKASVQRSPFLITNWRRYKNRCAKPDRNGSLYRAFPYAYL